MNPFEYIQSKIDSLVEIFPNIKCRYENDVFSRTHFIEIIPLNTYCSNKKYKKTEEEITFEFIELFPFENICFISDDSIVKIREVSYEKKGALYGLYESILIRNAEHITVTVGYDLADTLWNPITAEGFDINNLNSQVIKAASIFSPITSVELISVGSTHYSNLKIANSIPIKQNNLSNNLFDSNEYKSKQAA